MNIGSVPVSCLHTRCDGYRRATADTTQWLLTTDGMLKGEASGKERAEEVEETAVKSHLLQGNFIHHLQGRHKKGGDDCLLISLHVSAANTAASQTHTLCVATQTQQVITTTIHALFKWRS